MGSMLKKMFAVGDEKAIMVETSPKICYEMTGLFSGQEITSSKGGRVFFVGIGIDEPFENVMFFKNQNSDNVWHYTVKNKDHLLAMGFKIVDDELIIGKVCQFDCLITGKDEDDYIGIFIEPPANILKKTIKRCDLMIAVEKTIRISFLRALGDSFSTTNE